MEPNNITSIPDHELFQELATQISNLLSKQEDTVELRELDKRYTHANPKHGKCTMEGCSNKATHWLTRQSADYCQSDMVCNHHAMLWMQVKSLISQSSAT